MICYQCATFHSTFSTQFASECVFIVLLTGAGIVLIRWVPGVPLLRIYVIISSIIAQANVLFSLLAYWIWSAPFAVRALVLFVHASRTEKDMRTCASTCAIIARSMVDRRARYVSSALLPSCQLIINADISYLTFAIRETNVSPFFYQANNLWFW